MRTSSRSPPGLPVDPDRSTAPPGRARHRGERLGRPRACAPSTCPPRSSAVAVRGGPAATPATTAGDEPRSATCLGHRRSPGARTHARWRGRPAAAAPPRRPVPWSAVSASRRDPLRRPALGAGAAVRVRVEPHGQVTWRSSAGARARERRGRRRGARAAPLDRAAPARGQPPCGAPGRALARDRALLGHALALVPEPGRTRVHRRGDALLVPARPAGGAGRARALVPPPGARRMVPAVDAGGRRARRGPMSRR